MPRIRLAELALLYCAAIWGSTFYVVKDALAEVHPLTLVGWRFTIAGVLLLPWLLRQSPSSASEAGLAPAGVGRASAGIADGLLLGLIIAALYAAQTYGLLYTTAANSAFITGLFILFIPPLAFAFDRSLPARNQLLAVALALGGLWLLTGGPAGFNRGDLLTLIAAATYALHVLLTGRALARGRDPVALACWQLLACGLLSLLAAALVGAPLAVPGGRALSIVLFLTLLPTLSAYLLQLLAQRRVDPLRTALIFTLEPVFGAVFAWTLGGEALRLLPALGGLLIVAALLVADGAIWAALTRGSRSRSAA